MWRLVLAVLAFVGLWGGAAATAAHPGPGRIERHADFPSRFVAPRHVEVWLPPGYDASRKRYAVLYMHDGQNLFHLSDSNFNKVWAADEHVARLMAQGRIRDTIVVGMWSTPARYREYAPADLVARLPPNLREQWAANAGGPSVSDDYLRFIVEEVKPFVDARYRTDPGRRSTFIMGSSMGGLISFYALQRYPDVFAGAGCVSTHWPIGRPDAPDWSAETGRDAIMAAERAYIAAGAVSPRRHRIYFDHGDATLDAFYAPFQANVDAAMAAKGFTGRNWTSRVFPGAEHEENAWNARLDEPLLFLLGQRRG